jgi:hypothetical protein
VTVNKYCAKPMNTSQPAPAATPLALIHELWADHQHACPYVRHDPRGCYCASPKMPAAGDPYMPCDAVSLSLWCLTETDYPKCIFYAAEDVP